MRILLIEDSKRLQTYLAKGLRQVGYAVDVAGEGEHGLWAAMENEYDVVILDLMLPKLDGISVLQRLRSEGCDTHVLIITAKDTVPERVYGFEQGADDYLVKPFAFEEFLARVQALVRRSYGIKHQRMSFGDLSIDMASQTVMRQGEELELRPREFALLELLALRSGQVVSRTEIEQHIYDERAEPMSNVVDSAMCILRKKIDQSGRPSIIHTIRGAGYMLRVPQQ